MNRVDELIAILAPEGARFMTLGEVLRIKNGRDHKALGDGDIPVYGSGGIMRHVDTAAAGGPSVLIPRKGSLGNIFYVEGPFWVVDTIFRTEINTRLIEPKFVYHQLTAMGLGEMNQAGGVPSQTQSALSLLRIPVPPLEVQREIVRVLDQFTQLEAELEAELEARRRQYEHYKDVLLTFPEETQWGCVGDVCRVFGGAPFKSDYFNGLGDGLPVVRIRDINSGFSGTFYSGPFDDKYLVHDGDVLIGMDGDFKTVRWVHGDAVLNQRVSRLQDFDDENDPSFIFYLVRDAIKRIQDATQASTVKHLSTKQIAGIRIPLLPFGEQRERSAVLDEFDALVNDLSIGLPAELAARRKQYEYYRHKLLTFKEAA